MCYTNCDCLLQTQRVELESYVQSNSPDLPLTEVLPKISIFDVNEVVFAFKSYSCFIANLNKCSEIFDNLLVFQCYCFFSLQPHEMYKIR